MWIFLSLLTALHPFTSLSLNPEPAHSSSQQSLQVENQSVKVVHEDGLQAPSGEVEATVTNKSSFTPWCFDSGPIAYNDCRPLWHAIHGEPPFTSVRHWATPHDTGLLKSWRNDRCTIKLHAKAYHGAQVHDFSYEDLLASAASILRQCISQGQSGSVSAGYGSGYYLQVVSPWQEFGSASLASNTSTPPMSLIHRRGNTTGSAAAASRSNAFEVICVDNSSPVTVNQCRHVLEFMRRDRNFATRQRWFGNKRSNPQATWSLIGNPCHVDIRTPSEEMKGDVFAIGEAYHLAWALLRVCIREGQDGTTYLGHLGGGFMVTLGGQEIWEADEVVMPTSLGLGNDTVR